MAQNIVHGSRATLIINGKVVGLFTQVSWGVQREITPAYILGRTTPAELTRISQNAISVQASGFRIMNAGVFQVAGMPKLQDLFTADAIASLEVYDRISTQPIAVFTNVEVEGFSTSVAARSVSEFTVSFLAQMYAGDESGSQEEASGSPDLLSGT